MKCSIIISYKESGEDRKINLKRLLNYLSWLLSSETEIVLVEQGEESKIDWLNEIKNHEQINHIFVKNSNIFNKGWGYNIGAKEARGDYLIFNDSDIFIKLESYRFAVGLLGRFDVVNPYRLIYYLDSENSESFVKNNYNFNIIRGIEKPPISSGVISGGIFLMKKDKYLLLKGFDEDCYGYGHEDDIFDVKIKKLNLNVFTMQNEYSIHIYHQGITKNDDYYSFENVNKILFNEYSNLTEEELTKRIENVPYFGEKDKSIDYTSIRYIRKELFRSAAQSILDNMLSNINTDFIDDIIKESAEKAYETFIKAFEEKMKKEFEKFNITDKDKKSLIEKIIRKMKL